MNVLNVIRSIFLAGDLGAHAKILERRAGVWEAILIHTYLSLTQLTNQYRPYHFLGGIQTLSRRY